MYFSSVSSRLLLYDTNTWELKKCYGCYDGLLRDVSWSDDGKYILQVNCKGIVEILSAADHDVRSLQHIPVKDSWSAAFHRDGHRHVAIGTKNGNVMIWDTKNKCITKTFPSPSQQCPVDFISYNAKNTSLAATMHNGDTIIYGLASNIPVQTVKVPYSRSISCMKFHHDSRALLGLGADEGHVVLQDIFTHKEKVFFENSHRAPTSDIAYSLMNRDVMLSCGYDKITNVYDVRLQNIVSTIKTQQILTSLAINIENQVALGTKSGIILVYDLRNLANACKLLKGHEQEVTKVAFQPQRKRLQSVDVSLVEDASTYMSPVKGTSPIRNRHSDMFYISDSPPTNSMHSPIESHPKTDDSFLVMLGLDKSNDETTDDHRISNEHERRSDVQDRYRPTDTGKNISKISTPLTNRQNENELPSPLVLNGVPDDGRLSNINMPKANSNQNGAASMDTKVIEDLKDFIKLTVADVADDSRNYFLHVMMALTKQKLYLEKKLNTMSDQMNELRQQQVAVIEENRRLTLEMDQLKAKQPYF